MPHLSSSARCERSDPYGKDTNALLKNPIAPENYRPISLLTIGYKVMAAVIKARIEEEMKEQLRNTQYGF